jgi:hypothetical protein
MEPITISNLNLGSINSNQGLVLGEMLRVMLGLGDADSINVGVQAGVIPAPDFQAAPYTPQEWIWKSTSVAALIANQADINSVQSAVAAWRAAHPRAA